MFLRSNWLHYRWNVTSETDDRIDQLSKVIAMIKGNTIKQLEK
jgi:thymidylate synthase